MFTGIVETLASIAELRPEGNNLRLLLEPPQRLLTELQVDQSLAHNGVCLTVENLLPTAYEVVAVPETLQRTSLGRLKVGDSVNLERSLRADSRLDGHFVQGHVDALGEVIRREAVSGEESWVFGFRYPVRYAPLLVEKGSVCINGVSLTVVEASRDTFSVAIIPYTYQHTTFRTLQVGDAVNLEFDILGKYLQRYLQLREG